MNLQEALNYRSHCLLCGHDMETKCLDLAGIELHLTDRGLLVEAVGDKKRDYSVYFKFDGTYEKMKKWNNMYVKPFSVLRECPNCVPIIKVGDREVRIAVKQRALGPTTLNHLKDLRCAYTFYLFGDDAGKYTAYLAWDDLKYHDDKDFYHIKTDFVSNVTSLTCGKFDQPINSMYHAEVPAVNAKRISSKEQLISKLKLYNLFS